MTQTPWTPGLPGTAARRAATTAALLVLAALLVVQPAVSSPAAAQSLQTRWVGDLPIMEGMVIEPELGFAFDSPGGRIVLVFAATGEGAANVLSYYNAALASLGWAGADGSWSRGEESLTLAQVDTSVGRLWRIRLSPN
ncbi:MAG: hypothetical protein ACON31_04915 [Candidatus Puniceispirillaceae bacterium]